jgi:MFS family permease
LLVLCGALFLDALDVSMIGVALPSIRTDLHMSTSSLQWVVSAYVLGYGGFLLLGGRAADLLGRRRVFLISLGVFVVASALGGLANDGSLLIAARFVKGVSAAFTAPAGLSIITTTFAEGPARNKALSVYTATGATGFSLGLVFGGLLTEIGWRWVFFLPAPVALVALLAGIRLVPQSARPRFSRAFDIPGAVTMTGAMLLLILPAAAFERVVPFLLLGAVLLIALQPRLSRAMAHRRGQGERHTLPLPVTIYLAGIYGGYFAAAQGVILIALLGIFLADDLQRLNGLKNALTVVITGVAALLFVVVAPVVWPAALLLAAGSIVGGQVGAMLGRRLSPLLLRIVIMVVGTLVGLKLLIG